MMRETQKSTKALLKILELWGAILEDVKWECDKIRFSFEKTFVAKYGVKLGQG